MNVILEKYLLCIQKPCDIVVNQFVCFETMPPAIQTFLSMPCRDVNSIGNHNNHMKNFSANFDWYPDTNNLKGDT